jgi:hypothetical protein
MNNQTATQRQRRYVNWDAALGICLVFAPWVVIAGLAHLVARCL